MSSDPRTGPPLTATQLRREGYLHAAEIARTRADYLDDGTLPPVSGAQALRDLADLLEGPQ